MDEDIKKSVIMIVDDVSENLMLLVNIMKNQGYKIKALPNGKMAVKAALNNPPDLILLDVMMPDIDGYEVCKILKKDKRFESIPIIFVSALSDSFDKVKAFEVGCVDYVSKPFDSREIGARVKAHLTIRYLQKKVERYNSELEKVVSEQVKEISKGHLSIIAAMTKLAEARDDDTGRHIERTQNFCKIIAEELQKKDEFKNIIDDNFIINIFNSSPLHDIGKIAIPDRILLKPGKLTPEEFEIMKTHADIGRDYLKDAYNKLTKNSFLKMGVEIAGGHHEKWDGSGYPMGLSEADIPLSARIMAVADVYDALRSKRVYKDSFSHEKSVKIILEGKGKHFDPIIIDAFLNVEKEFNRIRENMGDI
ncbi:response regulator [Clostridium aciditolerans]|uniref:Stage 0 sporulation protein A homolog n=1 Tax=Clostridium aciditolerans TaxID=339861 RepID=A0A934HUD7_9CLOT|nr:HD domain-containing phosphohydrolase [Clostridium aciditolerans]MBI6872104.1 response regulator [Clostridium aciditolerans]